MNELKNTPNAAGGERTLDQQYWDERWENGTTNWDIGYASPAITDYMSQYPAKDAAILIPGCGNAHEAAFLVANGFTNITVLDIAPTAVATLRQKFKDSPEITVLHDDFFKHTGNYDLMIEQTFFCAIPIRQREEYVRQIASLLNPGGKLIGLLFNRVFEQEGPPFGGEMAAYRAMFEDRFIIKTMSSCYNSVPPRAGSELFINLTKK